jgi:hypothetical protein
LASAVMMSTWSEPRTVLIQDRCMACWIESVDAVSALSEKS